MALDILNNTTAELPKGWALTKLGEASDIIRGISFPKNAKTKTSQKGYIACLRTTNVQRKVEWGDLWFVPQEFVKRDEQLVKKYDILISTANSLELVGKVCQVKTLPYPSTLGAFISLIRISPILDQTFFYLQLNSSEVQSRIRSYASTTTNISNVSTKNLAKIQLMVSPLAEQKRIVAEIEQLFTKLEAGIEALKKIRKELKRYRQAVLKHAFEGKLTAEWREKNKDKLEPASKLLEQIAKEREKSAPARRCGKGKAKKLPPLDTSNLPELPDGWEWARLGSVALVASGQTPKGLKEVGSQGAIPFYKVGDMNRPGNEIYMRESKLAISSEEALSLGLHIRDKGTVIFPKRGGAIKTNKKRILTKPSAYDLNTMGLLLYVMPSKYFYYWVSAFDLASISDGSNVPQINHKDVEPLAFPIAPLEEQYQIVDEVEKHLSIADQIEQTIEQGLKQSDRLRQSILKKAFEGKLVPQDPSDEPAEKLLVRIKAEKESYSRSRRT